MSILTVESIFLSHYYTYSYENILKSFANQKARRQLLKLK